MKVDTQRKIDRILGTPICRLLSLTNLFSSFTARKGSPSKILVILLSEMGSLVLAKPMFDHLRTKYPKAGIYGLCFERNKEFLEILNVMPAENIFTVRGEVLSELMLDTLRVTLKMRRERIDTVLDCELFSRISSIYSFLSGASIKVGFHPYTQEGLYRGNFINRPVLYNPYHHISEQFMNLAEAIESEQWPKVKRAGDGRAFEPPRITLSEMEKEQFFSRLRADHPQLFRKRLVLLYPSGGLVPIRAWPWEHFCALSEEFLKKGYAVGIIGMKGDGELANRIVSHCADENCVDLAGYTRSVRELMTLFHLASLLITNDGGPGHFAVMTPMPSIVLFGPETPALYGPLGDKCIKLYRALSCSPCVTAYNHRNSPCDGDNQCLKGITPEEVLSQAIRLLEPVKDQEIKK